MATVLDEILKVFRPLLETERKMNLLLEEIEKNPDEQKIKQYSSLCERFEFLGGYTYQKEYELVCGNTYNYRVNGVKRYIELVK